MKTKEKVGISLIVLVITIIVIIILAGAVILSLATNNPIAQAREASFKTNVGEYKSELVLAISKEYLLYPSFEQSTFDKSVWDGNGNGAGTIKEYITSITVADAKKFEIRDSKLLYVGADQVEKDWLLKIGVENGTATTTGLGIDVKATENTTINGQAASYNNPIIPKGFKAINDGTVWPTGWNDGLVIEDVNGNQFVWVPVNGSTVTYAKWCTTGIAYNNANIFDDTLPLEFSESNITTKYKGFYIARYEAAFDYNTGNIRVQTKKSTNRDYSSWARDNAHTGYLWNYVSYTDSKMYSENMATSYGYDLTKVGTNLITGAQWDTTMKWIQNSGKSVTDTRAWGNCSNPISPANVTEMYWHLQISGFSEFWKANNIYDLAGNTLEWTNEKDTESLAVSRGGFYGLSGVTLPAAVRDSFNYNPQMIVTYRVALYVL